jgi:hypothetical protein
VDELTHGIARCRLLLRRRVGVRVADSVSERALTYRAPLARILKLTVHCDGSATYRLDSRTDDALTCGPCVARGHRNPLSGFALLSPDALRALALRAARSILLRAVGVARRLSGLAILLPRLVALNAQAIRGALLRVARALAFGLLRRSRGVALQPSARPRRFGRCALRRTRLVAHDALSITFALASLGGQRRLRGACGAAEVSERATRGRGVDVEK